MSKFKHIFWAEGLHFECTQCGGCCKGEPGTIYFTPEEIDRLVAYLGVDKDELLASHFLPYRDSYTARDDLDEGRCIFYEDGCSIYEVRPVQCRAYPFWRYILKDRRHWKEHAKQCPGMNRGRYYSPEEISEIAASSTV